MVPAEECNEHKVFLDSLPQGNATLLTLRDELYAGAWDSMEQDLNARLKKRAYIFNLANRIEHDLKTLNELRGYEQEHNIDLADYL